MPLTDNQLFTFHELGWVVVKRVLDQATVRKIKEEIADAHERFARPDAPQIPNVSCSWEPHVPKDQPKKIEQLMGGQIISPTLNQVLRRTDVLDMVEQILGPEIELFHSKFLMKAPNVGSGKFPWHQDYGYWHFSEKVPAQLNCAFAIDDQTIENGCLHYVPGSHKDGLREHLNFKAESFAWGLSTDFKAFKAVPVEYEAGDICFFGSLVIHGSEPNNTQSSATFNTTAYCVPTSHGDPAFKYETLRARTEKWGAALA
ncbi:MAG: phytanoyl-CoA dioxygenase family protein [Verrucomicrobiota bacterium]|nr:phytanoyl-CoA dioxygenase family protein [Verrucomicrobiota bacterium]